MPFATCTASLQERLDAMPGDELVPDAVLSFTHAVCVEVSPEKVWPWLAQMGAGRGGWYSHDWIDNGGVPSAERVLPDLQRIAPGDVLLGTPDADEGFVVAQVEVPRMLVLTWPARDGGTAVSWTFLLRSPPEGGRTRLLVRARLSRAALRPGSGLAPAGRSRAFVDRLYRALPHMPLPVVRAMAALGHGLMESRQLKGIKRRAEGRRSA